MMNPIGHSERPLTVVMADDDLDDISLVADALAECAFPTAFRSVADGYSLLQYLQRRGAYIDAERYPTPDVILLDLNMPVRNGTETLAEIKTTPYLRDIPIVVLTTSDAERDRHRTGGLGADRYLTKPNSYDSLVILMAALRDFHADASPTRRTGSY